MNRQNVTEPEPSAVFQCLEHFQAHAEHSRAIKEEIISQNDSVRFWIYEQIQICSLGLVTKDSTQMGREKLFCGY